MGGRKKKGGRRSRSICCSPFPLGRERKKGKKSPDTIKRDFKHYASLLFAFSSGGRKKKFLGGGKGGGRGGRRGKKWHRFVELDNSPLNRRAKGGKEKRKKKTNKGKKR